MKLVCFTALGIIASGMGAVVLVHASGLCPRFDEGAVKCSSPAAEMLGGIGLLIVLASAFTGLPMLLASAGLVFLCGEATAVLRRMLRRVVHRRA